MPRYEWDDFPESYIDLPDQWLGIHAEKRDQAMERGREEGFTGTLLSFFAALELLEDFRLPGFEGPPQNWDIRQTPLPIIARVNAAVWDSFSACFKIPKNGSGPSPTSEKDPAETMAQDGG